MSKSKIVNIEKGSVAVYAIATVFCFLIILGGVFAVSSSIRKNELKTLIKIKEIYAEKIEVEVPESEPTQKEYTFAYTGAVQEWIVPTTGKYKLQVWGAEGGTNSKNSTATAGKGGYSEGIVSLTKDETIYIYVGGEGEAATQPLGGFNSGNTTNKTNVSTATGGGGASDIRISTDSLYARVIVAGGGGGQGNTTGSGGYGGGTSGGNGLGTAANIGKGGTQIAGGVYPGGTDNPAGFGVGGSGPTGTTGGQGGRWLVRRIFRN